MNFVFQMSEEDSAEETQPEESFEEVDEESVSESSEEPKKPDECIIIPEYMKPIVNCCRDYDAGKIDGTSFFSSVLVSTGKFMQDVEKRRSGEQGE
jgi:hypothetical protein